MKTERIFLYVFLTTGLILFFSAALFPQNVPSVEEVRDREGLPPQEEVYTEEEENIPTEETTASGAEALPTGYKAYNFGDSIQTVNSSLGQDNMFLYEGEPDVTMIQPPDRTTIGVAGKEMLQNGFFVFYQEKLYEIILEINPEYLDYFALYMQLYKKYGEPKELNPNRVLWESESTILTLERSLFVKYIDKKVFEEVAQRMELKKGEIVESREEFLNAL